MFMYLIKGDIIEISYECFFLLFIILGESVITKTLLYKWEYSVKGNESDFLAVQLVIQWNLSNDK